ncbi:universal stress protein [Terrabacter sp. MAHUQ-38]|uniref:universal stress protein n=1 Tax=unclassified Terrabacter TaxID=2630222 RepID=UPI00165E2552|nr:universal stress protein [Terrabacter sp. MAHUQ-38]MBC9821198.1 universal stress protein [Terrabacter sp. MAHUQ-38]
MTQAGTIVVGIDGSKESREALRWACEEASLRKHHVLAVAVWNVFPVTTDPLLGTAAFDAVDPERTTKETLSQFVTEARQRHPDIDVTPKVIAGHPAEQLITLSEGAAMLVVGAQGHGGFLGMLLGSTSRHVLNHSGCTVVVVR